MLHSDAPMQELQELRVWRTYLNLEHPSTASLSADADATQTDGACEDDKPLRPRPLPRLEGPFHAYTEK